MNNAVTQGRRVRSATPQQRNLQIDEVTYENIKRYAGKPEAEITSRIKELENEWDVERILGPNMSTLGVIEEEKHALKALRGDYAGVTSAGEAFIAVKKRKP